MNADVCHERSGATLQRSNSALAEAYGPHIVELTMKRSLNKKTRTPINNRHPGAVYGHGTLQLHVQKKVTVHHFLKQIQSSLALH